MAGYRGTYVLEYFSPDASDWVDLTCYLYTCGWGWGRDYNSQLVGRSTPLSITVLLNNQDGRFSRYNTASPYYTGFDPLFPFELKKDVQVRFRMTDPVATTLWHGFLKELHIDIPMGTPGTATMSLTGYIGRLAGETPTIPTTHWVAFDTRELLVALLDDFYTVTSILTADSDPDGANAPPVWYLTRTAVVDELRLMETAEAGFIGDANNGLIYHNRHHRSTYARCTTSQATYSDALAAPFGYSSIVPDEGERDVFNISSVTVQPYDHDDDADTNPHTIVWTHPLENTDNFYLEPGDTMQVGVTWDAIEKPTNAAYVIQWVFGDPLTPITLQAFDAPNGAGAEVTADVDVIDSAFPAVQGLTFTLENTGAVRAYLYILRVGAQFGYAIPSITYSARNEASIAALGPHAFPIDTPWLAPQDGPFYPPFIVDRYGGQHGRLVLGFRANNSQALLEDLVERQFADRVTIEADRFTGGPPRGTYLGIDEDFFIERLEHQVDRNRVHTVLMHVSPAARWDQGAWILGQSQLGTDTVLIF